MPAAFLPARHWSNRNDRFSVRAALSDERGCRRDIRSNGWIELRSSRLRKPVRQKKPVFFVRCGSLEIRNFTRHQFARVGSGPDVFADALAPSRSGSARPYRSQDISRKHRRFEPHSSLRVAFTRCLDGYPFAKAARLTDGGFRGNAPPDRPFLNSPSLSTGWPFTSNSSRSLNRPSNCLAMIARYAGQRRREALNCGRGPRAGRSGQ
jgi:hypothetical protein